MSHVASENQGAPRPLGPAEAPFDPAKFQRQLTVATLGLLFVVLLVSILERCESILQPLLIALFVCYIIVPIHGWLVRRGLPPAVAYVILVATTLTLFLILGQQVYSNLRDLDEERLREYEDRLEEIIRRGRRVFATTP